MLGNDIVDVSFCEPPAYRNLRYLDRVCTPEEADGVRRSIDPVRALALIWASKEAAYKLLSKYLPECHFVPRQFVIEIEKRDAVQFDKKLSVLYRGVQTEVSIFTEERWLHAVTLVPAMKIRWMVREIEKCSLRGRKASSESEAVRFLAKELLEELCLEELSLQFEGRVPKLKHNDGCYAGVDVSLAHHGAFAAAAIAWPACCSESQPWGDADFAEIRNSEAVCSTCTA